MANRTMDLDGLTHVSTGLCPGCEECASGLGMDLATFNAEYEVDGLCHEASFSWGGCDTCSTILGGNRRHAHGLDSDGALVHLDICDECLFAING